jgi:hypothetical protein
MFRPVFHEFIWEFNHLARAHNRLGCLPMQRFVQYAGARADGSDLITVAITSEKQAYDSYFPFNIENDSSKEFGYDYHGSKHAFEQLYGSEL